MGEFVILTVFLMFSAFCSVKGQDNNTPPGACRIEKFPSNGWIEAVSYQKLSLGDWVRPLTTINYRCPQNYRIEGDTRDFCSNGKFGKPTPDCQARCSSEGINGPSFKATICTLNGQPVRCGEPAKPETIARINCRDRYEPLRGASEQTIFCRANGTWSQSPQPCTPICGEEASKGTPFVVGGFETEIGKVPWHVGIYLFNEYKYDFRCGGTIINARVVISAMHCFWDRRENRPYNVSLLRIAAGKDYLEFDAMENHRDQKFEVDQISYYDGYSDAAGNYAADIVLVILKNSIEFGSYVAPICIQFGLPYEERIVPAGLRGRVAGWGKTSSVGDPSPKLKYVELPTIDKEQCLAESEIGFRPQITVDKFCAGYLNANVSVCQGDSGGGLVVPKDINGRVKWYLRGIVSTGAKRQDSCDSDKYATFTNILHYEPLIAVWEPFGVCRITSIPRNGWIENSSGSKLALQEWVHSSEQITYKCHQNYQLKGPDTNICIDGKFKSPAPECKAQCNTDILLRSSFALSSCFLNDRKIACSESLEPGTIVLLKCHDHDDLATEIEERIITCGSNGVWSSIPEACTPIYEDTKPTPEKTSYDPNSNPYGTNPFRECQITKVPRNGWIENNLGEKLFRGEWIEIGSEIYYKCFQNYLHVGATKEVCDDGELRDTLPDCQPRCSLKTINRDSLRTSKCHLNGNEVRCQEPAKPGTIVHIDCRYERTSEMREQIITCGDDGEWSPAPGTCNSDSDSTSMQATPFGACRITIEPRNGWIENNLGEVLSINEWVNSGSQIFYRCSQNYSIQGVRENTCAHGFFEQAPPDCRPKCSVRAINADSIWATSCRVNGNTVSCSISAEPGTVAYISCRDRFKSPFGSEYQTTVCGRKGIWSPEPAPCIPIRSKKPLSSPLQTNPFDECLITKVPHHGWIENSLGDRLNSGAWISALTQIAYKCHQYHYLDGSEVNMCVNGEFREPIPDCQARCDAGAIIGESFVASGCVLDGRSVPCSKSSESGTVAYLTCRDQYESRFTSEDQIVSCQDNGVWSPQPGSCTPLREQGALKSARTYFDPNTNPFGIYPYGQSLSSTNV